MAPDNRKKTEFYKDLRLFLEESFPKTCNNCGRIYDTLDDFLALTRMVGNTSGLKESFIENDERVIELLRKCICGSPLIEIFKNRRNITQKGLQRRKRFDSLLGLLSETGMDMVTARVELLNLVRGNGSTIIRESVRVGNVYGKALCGVDGLDLDQYLSI